MHMWDMSFGTGWWLFGGLWMLIFWGLIIALIVWVIKKITERGSSVTKNEPLEIARERYAKGEITSKEFNQIKNNLA